jgi:hypothetical protein
MDTPLFKDLSDDALIASYWSYKALAHNAAALKSPKLGTLLRHLDIMTPFICYYECAVCKKRHEGGVATPPTVSMVPAAKPNEFHFVCQPPCKVR